MALLGGGGWQLQSGRHHLSDSCFLCYLHPVGSTAWPWPSGSSSRAGTRCHSHRRACHSRVGAKSERWLVGHLSLRERESWLGSGPVGQERCCTESEGAVAATVLSAGLTRGPRQSKGSLQAGQGRSPADRDTYDVGMTWSPGSLRPDVGCSLQGGPS